MPKSCHVRNFKTYDFEHADDLAISGTRVTSLEPADEACSHRSGLRELILGQSCGLAPLAY